MGPIFQAATLVGVRLHRFMRWLSGLPQDLLPASHRGLLINGVVLSAVPWLSPTVFVVTVDFS